MVFKIPTYLLTIVVACTTSSIAFAAKTKKKCRNLLVEESRATGYSKLKDFQITTKWISGDRYFPNINGDSPAKILTINVSGHTIEIVAGLTAGLEEHIEDVYQPLLDLPETQIDALATIRLNLRPYRGGDRTAALSDKQEIDLYQPMLEQIENRSELGKKIIRHEFGHLIANRWFGSSEPSDEYKSVAKNDSGDLREFTPERRGNGKGVWREDFADGMELYLRTNGGSNLDIRSNSKIDLDFSTNGRGNCAPVLSIG